MGRPAGHRAEHAGALYQPRTRARREAAALSTRWPSVETSITWRNPAPVGAPSPISASISRIRTCRAASPDSSGPAPS